MLLNLTTGASAAEPPRVGLCADAASSIDGRVSAALWSHRRRQSHTTMYLAADGQSGHCLLLCGAALLASEFMLQL